MLRLKVVNRPSKEVNRIIRYGWAGLCFVYATGMRLSAAFKTTFTDIDRDRLQIRVCRGKGAKDRIVHIPQCLMNILTDYNLRCKSEKYLFIGLKKEETLVTALL